MLLAAAVAILATTAPASAWFAARGFGGGFAAGGFDRFGAVGWHGVGCYGCGVWRPAVPYAWPAGAVAAGLGGLAAGAAIGAAAAAYPIGTDIAVLPGGCVQAPVGALNYHRCGSAWFRPYYGGGGLYYRAVPVP